MLLSLRISKLRLLRMIKENDHQKKVLEIQQFWKSFLEKNQIINKKIDENDFDRKNFWMKYEQPLVEKNNRIFIILSKKEVKRSDPLGSQ